MLQFGWKVKQFFPYSRFENLGANAFGLGYKRGDQIDEFENDLVGQARLDGHKADRDNKIAFLIEEESTGRQLVLWFGDWKMYVIPYPLPKT